MRKGYQVVKTKAFTVVGLNGTPSNIPDVSKVNEKLKSEKLPFAIDVNNQNEPVRPTRDTNTEGDADDIYYIQAQITKQQSLIKQLKKDGVSSENLADENLKLNELRNKLLELEKGKDISQPFNRKSFDELILRKMYVVPSFEIHNGPAGLFDYGPPACALKTNVLSLWRQFFVLEENMLEMECTNLTPSAVLETSGHVERFTDFMVKDEKTGECFRADKLLEDVIDNVISANPKMPVAERDVHLLVQRQAGSYNADQLEEMLKKYNVKSPSNKENDLTAPFPFNLMFKTSIGPEGTAVGYLRPETAQGLFVNFRRLLDFNQQKMPFAAAQVGLGFRNEIAPRNGLLRVREFCMAEIEHFVNPNDKAHPKFQSVAKKVVVLFPQENQLGNGRTVETTIGEAVRGGIVNNETLGYFMARTQMWLEKIGVDKSRMRFRQHLRTEMAHYAADCWDMEILMSYGWIECVGHADRACYDLQQHSNRTGVPMLAAQRLPEPVVIERVIAEPNKKLIGPKFKGEQKTVITMLESLEDSDVIALRDSLAQSSSAVIKGFTITPELVTFSTEKKTVVETKYTPSVIEPSYGIGRILYAVLEHSFTQRDGDEQRCVMKFRPCVAPVKVGLFRLINNPQFDPIVESIRSQLMAGGMPVKVDSSSGTIGRRYARADELGIPFGVTVDFQSLTDDAVTVRERDSTTQVRVPLGRIISLLQALITEDLSWTQVVQRYPLISSAGADDEEEASDGVKPEKSNTVQVAPVIIQKCSRASFSRPNPEFNS